MGAELLSLILLPRSLKPGSHLVLYQVSYFSILPTALVHLHEVHHPTSTPLPTLLKSSLPDKHYKEFVPVSYCCVTNDPHLGVGETTSSEYV